MIFPRRLPLLFLFFAAPALAQDHPTYESLRADMDAKGCTAKDAPGYTIFSCNRERADYYFTADTHPAHPAVVKRFLDRDNATETWWSFGGDAAAMTAWLDKFHRLDRTAPHRWPLQTQLPSSQ